MCLEISQQSEYKTETLKRKYIFFLKMRKSGVWLRFFGLVLEGWVSSSSFFFHHKLRYQFWVPPSPECLTQTSSTHYCPRREKQACPSSLLVYQQGKPAKKIPVLLLPNCIPPGYRIFTEPSSVIVRSHVPLTWCQCVHFATNPCSHRTSTMFVMEVQTSKKRRTGTAGVISDYW